MSNLNENQEQAIEQAKREGFIVVRGRPTRLLLDLDYDPVIRDDYGQALSYVTQELRARGVTLTEVSSWTLKNCSRFRSQERVPVSDA
jgi:hypothetical protein